MSTWRNIGAALDDSDPAPLLEKRSGNGGAYACDCRQLRVPIACLQLPLRMPTDSWES